MSFDVNHIKYQSITDHSEVKFGEDSHALEIQLAPAPDLFIIKSNFFNREIRFKFDHDQIQFSANQETINKIKSHFNYYFNPISDSEKSKYELPGNLKKYQISARNIKAFFQAVLTVQKENPKSFIPYTLFQKTIKSLDVYQQLTESNIKDLTSSLRLLPTQDEFEQTTRQTKNVDSAIYLAKHYQKTALDEGYGLNRALYWICQANIYSDSSLHKNKDIDAFLHSFTTINEESIFDKKNNNLLESLAKSTSLQKIILDAWTDYDIAKAEQIGKLIATSTSIRDVDLCSTWSSKSNRLDETTVTPIAKALESSISIESLGFSNTSIRDKGLVQIMNAIEKNPNSKMTSINCASCGITDAITENILSFLKLAPNPVDIHITRYTHTMSEENRTKIERAIEERLKNNVRC